MRPIFSVFIATSLDGFIARSDGGLDWLEHESGGEDYGYAAFIATVDTLVMGRRTYDTALAFAEWPYAAQRVVVLSRRLGTADVPEPLRGRVAISNSPPETLAAELAAAGARHVYVDGGETIRGFLAAGLIDALTVSVLPVLLGDGIPLFGGPARDRRLELVASRAFASGLVQSTYRVAGGA